MLGEEAVSSGRTFDQKGAGLHTYTAPAHEGAEKKDKFNLDDYDEYGRQRTQKGVLRHPSRRSPSPSPSPGTGAR